MAGSLDNQGKYELTVEDVESVVGFELEKTTVEFTAFDATLPEVTAVNVTGPSTFEIVFSEPVEEEGEVTVTQGNLTLGVNQTFTADGTNKVTVELFSDFEDGKEYKVNIKGFKDFAGYNNIVTTETINYVLDTAAPTATITSAEQTYVVVEFDKYVTGLSADNFYHTFSAWGAEEIYSDSAMEDEVEVTDAVNKVWVKFYDVDGEEGYPLPEGNINVTVLNKVGSVEVKDQWGNKFETITQTVTVAADKVAPTVEKVEVESGTEIKVTFSKNVSNGTTKANYTLTLNDGTEVDIDEVTASGKVFTVVAGEDLTGETVTLAIKDIEDTALVPNKLANYSTVFQVADTKFDGIDKVRVAEGVATDKNYLYVFYNEAVTNTALDVKNNYRLLDGTTYSAMPGKAEFFNGNKIVRITLTDDELDAVLDVANVAVRNVKDLEGNTFADFQVLLDTTDFDAIEDDAPEIESITLKSSNTLEVQFNQELTRIDRAALSVLLDDVDQDVASFSTTNNSKGTLITVVVKEKDLGTKIGAGTEIKVSIADPTDGPRFGNIFSVAAEEGTIASTDTTVYVDKAAAQIDEIEFTAADEITITFTEAVESQTFSRNTFTVSGNTVAEYSLVGDTLVLTLEDEVEDGKTVTVKQVLDFEDIPGNVTSGLEKKVKYEE